MAYRIPLFDLTMDEREHEAVLGALRDKWISMGPRTEEFERRFGELLGTSHALAVANCTAALHLALLALGVGRDDEVIVPSLTFVATVAAVRYVDAVPVFCDITGIDTPTIDPEQVARAIGPRTRAIMVMHYGGFPCQMDAIMDIADRHGLPVVEDAAHAPGSRFQARPVGTIGDIGCFSFFSNKNLTTAEGGIIVARSDEHYRQLKLLRSHGMTTLSFDRARGHSTSYDVVAVGYNYRIDDIRAALGLAQLGRLPVDFEQRRVLRQRYLSRLSGRKDVVIPFERADEDVSNYILPIVLTDDCPLDRETVRNALAEQGIQTSVHYPAVHRFSVYQPYARSLPKTEFFADRTLTLPLYPTLAPEQVDEVCRALTGVLDRSGSLSPITR